MGCQMDRLKSLLDTATAWIEENPLTTIVLGTVALVIVIALIAK